MGPFSQREYGIKSIQIVDQAPAWLRTSFFERVYKRMKSQLGGVGFPPTTTRRLAEKLSSWLQEAYGSGISFGDADDQVERLLHCVEWFYFYDAIEFIADQIRLFRLSAGNGSNPPPLHMSGFHFRELVNELFDDSNVGWVLDSSGLLKRKLDFAVEDLLVELRGGNSPSSVAQIHIGKARRMLDRSSSDFENSIKESIGALESVGRATFPDASTFGDVLKELRNKQDCRGEMISILQKAYDFSNSAPGIRHAGVEPGNITRSEAEYIYLLSLASIKYLGEEGII